MSAYEMPELQTSGATRQRDGIIVTLREQTTGRLDTVHATGQIRKAIVDICDEAEARDGHWLVQSVSTPSSIYRDLQGVRGEITESDLYRQRNASDPRSAEQMLLGQVGKLHMLQPLRNPGADIFRGKVA